ncbi:M23 family metallopeptidase [Algoriphagus kandeliae]|uniref:M23 family metallopeptidase n=1 Tax=Algoriphagus kandeliae TaxID=2562278 RepID=A0A4Y9R0G4_9BACT|nr:M23 family metallopeptidase [Algoriphagus kandeliae]TFV97292.1 M23 family metallopeptidase [Algoriphagus kandeliae]
MKLNKAFPTFLVTFFLSILSAWSQEIIQDYFRSPVKPEGRNYLSGNFSELRPNHFHTGLDYKFGGVEGEPIYAAADGWVHRIKISTYGYGNVIYLKHPTGHITVYGHLRNFIPKLQRYIIEEMYKQQVNELELMPAPGELSVKKGELIANGGNSGSSGGPHLHFEIRDSLDRAMDPLQFGFPEILDNIPPTPQTIALVPLDINSRINGEFARREFTLVKNGTHYSIPQTIEITGRVGVEIRSFDQLDGASNRNGFPHFELWKNDSLTFSMSVDKVDFNFTRQFLLHTHQNRFTKLYFQPELKFDYFFPKTPVTGHLEAEIGERVNYQLRLRDAYGNERKIDFKLLGKDQEFFVNLSATPQRAQVNYQGNILKIEAPSSNLGGLAKFYVGSRIFEMLPSYQDDQTRVYLWDMRFGIPEEVDICSEVVIPEVKQRIHVGEEHLFAEKSVQISFNENTLLEDLYLRISENGSSTNPRLQINDTDEYLWNSMEVLWNVSAGNFDKSRTHVYQVSPSGRKSFVGGAWEDASIRFSTRNFGTFTLTEDKTGPIIRPVRISRDEIRFTIRDELSGIKNFEAFVDGKWVLMRYEHKKSLIWSETLDKQPLSGQVILRVTDQAGNVSEWKGTIS